MIPCLAIAKVGAAGQLHERDADGVLIKVEGTLGEGFILVGAFTTIDSFWAELQRQSGGKLTQLVDVYILLG